MTRLHTVLLTTTALAALGLASAVAGPDGANVVGGSATMHGQGSASVTINQSSERAIINWRQFDIGAGETTRFNQPSSSSVALNRVTGGLGPTQIMGTLSANGRVFVVNRDGILFGPNSKIDTAGFLATTNDIRNDDFMAGRYRFDIPGRPDASIVNHGTITAHSAGFAALVAPGVRNTGTITATLGTVGLASGNGFTLDFYGDRLITLAVGDSIGTTVRDVQTGQPLNSLVENAGRIQANGGRVELTAVEARRVVDSVINNRGVVEANTVGTRGGTIVLGAATTRTASAPRQTVRVGGTLSAAAPKGTKNAKIKDGSGEGGRVIVTGENIEVAGARIDVSGPARGGTVLIGGDWAGGNPNTSAVSHANARLENNAIPTAATVTVDSSTVIDASATEHGNAGKVIVWADGATSFRGSILARGGEYGGDGGFVEVSGHQFLDYRGTVDTRAPMGAMGTLLVDPYNVTISSEQTAGGALTGGTFNPTADNSVLNVGQLNTALTTSSVVVTTGGTGSPGDQDGNITIANNTAVSWSGPSTLTLSAFDRIIFERGASITNNGSGNLIMRADNSGRRNDNSPTGFGTVHFATNNQVDFSQSTGTVSIYYNPNSYQTGGNQYQHPTDFTSNVSVASAAQLVPYMLVNNATDLQRIGETEGTLSRTYALGRDINLANVQNFTPLGNFTGTLDGTVALVQIGRSKT
jgi:filamentous hemagglutinin family protein